MMVADYDEIIEAVRDGVFVALAPGVMDGEPVIAWFACDLDRRARRFAYSRDDQCRAAQGIGAVMQLRLHAGLNA